MSRAAVFEWEQVLARAVPGDHLVQVYADPVFLYQSVTRFVDAGLKHGRAAVLILRDTHWERIVEQLRERGWAMDALLTTRQVVRVSADDTLRRLLIDGRPDGRIFRDVVGGLIARASQRYGSVCAYGEMVDILWRDGKQEAAIILEELWNALAKTQLFYLLCGYSLDGLSGDIYGGPLQWIAEKHTHLIPAEDYVKWNSAIERALAELLEPQELATLVKLSRHQFRQTQMPVATAQLMCLGQRMPSLGIKVGRRATQYYQKAQNSI